MPSLEAAAAAAEVEVEVAEAEVAEAVTYSVDDFQVNPKSFHFLIQQNWISFHSMSVDAYVAEFR